MAWPLSLLVSWCHFCTREWSTKTGVSSFLSPPSCPSRFARLTWFSARPPAQPKGDSKNVQAREGSHLPGATWVYVVLKQSGDCHLSLPIKNFKLLRCGLVKCLMFQQNTVHCCTDYHRLWQWKRWTCFHDMHKLRKYVRKPHLQRKDVVTYFSPQRLPLPNCSSNFFSNVSIRRTLFVTCPSASLLWTCIIRRFRPSLLMGVHRRCSWWKKCGLYIFYIFI